MPANRVRFSISAHVAGKVGDGRRDCRGDDDATVDTLKASNVTAEGLEAAARPAKQSMRTLSNDPDVYPDPDPKIEAYLDLLELADALRELADKLSQQAAKLYPDPEIEDYLELLELADGQRELAGKHRQQAAKLSQQAAKKFKNLTAEQQRRADDRRHGGPILEVNLVLNPNDGTPRSALTAESLVAEGHETRPLVRTDHGVEDAADAAAPSPPVLPRASENAFPDNSNAPRVAETDGSMAYTADSPSTLEMVRGDVASTFSVPGVTEIAQVQVQPESTLMERDDNPLLGGTNSGDDEQEEKNGD